MKLSLAVIFVLAALTAESNAYRRVCYYSSWSIYYEGQGHFEPEMLGADLCTHIIYAFVGVDENGNIQLMDEWTDVGDQWTEGLIQRINHLKDSNPNLKTMVACGGWSFGTRIFSIVANDPQKRQNFANSAADFLNKYGLNGMDIDWEYPAIGDGTQPSDKQAFIEMIKVFRERFDRDGLLLSAATSAVNVETSYDIPSLSQYLDFVNIMTYDLHGTWEGITGHHSPLHYGSYLDQHGGDRSSNIESIINFFIDRGSDPQKLNLGVPFYARTFTLSNSNDNGFGAPISGPGRPGTFYAEEGGLAYNEICFLQGQGQWGERFDNEQGIPYAVNGDQWAGYDSPQSLRLKADFVKGKNVGGVMVWSVDTDDHSGTCTGQNFPLLNTLKEQFPN